jgi:hypothetical protein
MDEIFRSQPQALARLFSAGAQGTTWSHADLGAVLRHQLSAPLLVDLRRLPHWPGAEAGPSGNFGELLAHPCPPLELLRLTKEFAKAADQQEDRPLPVEVATMLYYAAIVAALVGCGERISRLSDDELRQGVAWALAQPFIAPQVRPLFERGRDYLAVCGEAE